MKLTAQNKLQPTPDPREWLLQTLAISQHAWDTHKPDRQTVSFWTVDGRQPMGRRCGERQRARLAGAPVVVADPRSTARACPLCAGVDQRHRLIQSAFSCVSLRPRTLSQPGIPGLL
jgi:hypothetical protein